MYDSWCGLDASSSAGGGASSETAWISPPDNDALVRARLLPPLTMDPDHGLEGNQELTLEEDRLDFFWDVGPGYDVWHHEVESVWPREKRKNYIVFGCHSGAYACGGHADRWAGIFVAFLLALTTGRQLLIDMPDPVGLENFLTPRRDLVSGERNVDWVVTDKLRRKLNLPGRRAELLWSYDDFRDEHFRNFLADQSEVGSFWFFGVVAIRGVEIEVSGNGIIMLWGCDSRVRVNLGRFLYSAFWFYCIAFPLSSPIISFHHNPTFSQKITIPLTTR